jgi:hypothetical protein
VCCRYQCRAGTPYQKIWCVLHTCAYDPCCLSARHDHTHAHASVKKQTSHAYVKKHTSQDHTCPHTCHTCPHPPPSGKKQAKNKGNGTPSCAGLTSSMSSHSHPPCLVPVCLASNAYLGCLGCSMCSRPATSYLAASLQRHLKCPAFLMLPNRWVRQEMGATRDRCDR